MRPTPLVILAALAALVLAEFAYLAWRADRIPLLQDGDGGRWIKVDAPVDLAAWDDGQRTAGFVLTLDLEQRPGVLPLSLQAFRSATLFVNGSEAGRTAPSDAALAQLEIDIAPHVQAGSNQILVVVTNDHGPPALRVASPLPGFASSRNWLASADAKAWTAARETAVIEGSALAAAFPVPWDALRRGWTTALALAAAGLAWLVAAQALAKRHSPARLLRVWRWVLVGALALLFGYNFSRLPAHVGMDLDAHLEYLDFILAQGRLPLGNQGWQMFQAPLAYLLAAGVAKTAQALGLAFQPAYLGRALTMVASLATVWFGCLAVARVLARHPATAAAAVTISATLPAGIYMAHAFGNEPWFALFGVLALHRLACAATDPPQAPLRHAAALGLFCGLALLAKTSAIILVPAVAAALLWQLRADGRDTRVTARALAVYLVVTACVAGWWYLRNVIELGRPFVGGWDSGRGVDWWQYPGYRLWGHLTDFGAVLSRPVYAGVLGFWDGLYSTLWGDGFLSGAIVRSYAPNWNYETMPTLYLLALPLVAAVAAGAVRTLSAPAAVAELPLGRYCSALLALYVAAAFHLYATVPIYSAAKGSYLLVLAPCLGILGGWGMEPLLRHRSGRALAAGFLGLWTGSVGLSFIAGALP